MNVYQTSEDDLKHSNAQKSYNGMKRENWIPNCIAIILSKHQPSVKYCRLRNTMQISLNVLPERIALSFWSAREIERDAARYAWVFLLIDGPFKEHVLPFDETPIPMDFKLLASLVCETLPSPWGFLPGRLLIWENSNSNVSGWVLRASKTFWASSRKARAWRPQGSC